MQLQLLHSMHCITLPEGRSPMEKLLFFWILSKLPPPSPRFGQLVQFVPNVKIKNLKVSLG